MNLDQMMRDATDDTVVDLDRLTRAASSQGRGIRRRRRLTGIVAGACMVGVSVVGVSLVTRPAAPDLARDAATDTSAPAAGTAVEPAPPVALDGRATAALLRAVVDEVADGAVDGFAGQGGGDHDFFGTYAELVLAPAGETGSGVVGVNVQDVSILAGERNTCASYMGECAVTKLPGGDILRTYRDPSESAAGTDIRRVAELISEARGLRVVVSATNGFDLSGNEWDVTRDTPVLTAEQLTAIVTDERWAFEVPAEYAEQGAGLAPYKDLDANQGWLSPEEEAAQG